jgi:hypothetical protein
MKMNKKGFLLRDVGIALVFSMTIIALFVIISQAMASNYSRSDLVNPSFAQHYNKLDSLTTTVEKSHSAVTGTQGSTLLGNFDVVFNSFFAVVGIVWDSYNIILSGISSIASDFTFIPQSVIYILLTSLISGLLIYVIFSVISSVTRGRV